MSTPQLLPAGALSTAGNQIVDVTGNPVRIAAVNWSGAQLRRAVPEGLSQANYTALLDTVKALGFNTICIALCDAAVIANDTPTSGAFSTSLNPAMAGLAYLGVIDLIVAYCATNGLRVILVSHNSEGAGTGANPNGLWYDHGAGSNGTDGSVSGTVTDAAFLAMWQTIATRYKSAAAIVGYVLRNRPSVANGAGATWGDGSNRDIAAMYRRVGNAIQAIDPRPLIICSGVQNNAGTFATGSFPDGIAYGQGNSIIASAGDLSGVRTTPVVLGGANKVVYAVNEFPMEATGLAIDIGGQTKINQMTAAWGFLAVDAIAPVMVAAMGSYFNGTAAQLSASSTWANMMVSYCNGAVLGGPVFNGNQQGISTSWWLLAVDETGGLVPDYGVLTAWTNGTARSRQAAIFQDLQFYGAGALTVTAQAAASPNGLIVTPGGGLITDINANTWGITSGGQITVNGVVDPVTQAVVQLAYISGLVWQNAYSLWWSKSTPTDTWLPVGGTSTSPIGAAPVASADGTIVTSAGAAITDANGNLWAFNNSGQVVVNGVADLTTAGIVELAFVNHLIWKSTAGGLWQSKTLPTDSWLPVPATTVTPITVAVTTTTGSTLVPVGLYPGYDPAANLTAFNTQWDNYTTLAGRAPTHYVCFLDEHYAAYNPGGYDWPSQASYQISGMQASSRLTNVIPVIGMPFGLNGGGNYFAALANGSYDSMIQSMMAQFKAAGYATQYWRPGWEMNVQPWIVNTGNAAAYVAAWQHVANVMHAYAAANGIVCYLIWNPNVWTLGSGVTLASIYPGDSYVDVLGIDEYGNGVDNGWTGYPPGATTTDNTKFLLTTMFDMVTGSNGQTLGRGKPISIPESGSNDVAFANAMVTALSNRNPAIVIAFFGVWENSFGIVSWSNPGDGQTALANAWMAGLGASGTIKNGGTVVTTGPRTQPAGGGLVPLALFPGIDPNVDKPGFTAQWTNLATLAGRAPTLYTCFLDKNHPADPAASDPNNTPNNTVSGYGWVQQANYIVAGMQNVAPLLASAAPLIAVPFGLDAQGHAANSTYFAAITAGTYDTLIQGMLGAFKAAGWATQYWRPGWEFNVASFPWMVTSGTVAAFVAAFQHFVTVARAYAAGNGITLFIIWNPNVYTLGSGVTLTAAYPGDAYVDILGIDQFGTGLDANWASYGPASTTTDNTIYLLNTMLDMSTGANGQTLGRGKPVCIGESGANDTAFINAMLTALTNRSAAATMAFFGVYENASGIVSWSNPGDNQSAVSAAWMAGLGASGSVRNGVAATPPAAPAATTWNILNGLVAWAGGTAVVRGQRVSNNGLAYQCVSPGTTAAGGGPTGTLSNILDGTARWTFLTSVEFPNRAGATAVLPLTLTAAITLRFWNLASQTTTSAVPFLTLSGHATGAYSLTLTAGPPDSLRASLASQSLPLALNTANGATFLQPLAVAAMANYTVINDPSVTIDGLQFQDPSGASASSILQVGSANTSLVVRNCIFDGASQASPASMVQVANSGSVRFVNCLFIDRQASGGSYPTVVVASGATSVRFVNCTFIAINSPASAPPLQSALAGTIARNCAFFGYGATGGANITFDHCASSAASFGAGTDGGNNQFNLSAAAQFVSPTSDWRTLGTSALIGTGVIDLTDIPTADDITGAPRHQAASWSIGCWERLAFTPAEIRPPPSKFW